MLSGDDDPERLHQFRVAMRKQRALLSQLAPLFDPDWAGAHREKLAALMRRTGAKRDIDVYLLKIPYYRSLLPEKHHEGLEKLAEYLKTKEREVRQALRDFLESAELTEELEALARFCRRDDGEGLRERAAGPVVLEVKKALRRRYDRVLKKGAAIDARSEAEAYHRVRIDVKKLRYLMEFFAAIFETEAYREMLGKLKSIQTILGEHQDLDVQRSHLKAFASLDALHDAKTREAIAVLRETMAKLEERKRKAFRDAFADFSETSGLLKRMVCHY
jgi:CHAD domain-containing protein